MVLLYLGLQGRLAMYGLGMVPLGNLNLAKPPLGSPQAKEVALLGILGTFHSVHSVIQLLVNQVRNWGRGDQRREGTKEGWRFSSQ